jgi:KaiC/GvpD/RAD55 family RecA-like ATPase
VADTNVGKSIFAVQISNEIAREQRVLYIDLELSDKQFERRYSEDFTNHFHFHENLMRVDFTQHFSIPDNVTYDDYFIASLVELIKRTEARVVVIDNMTKLISTDTDSAGKAKPLMDRLCALKMDFGLTLILLEHTRKCDSTRPITLNDIQGSKMKVNFADAVFAIGRSVKDTNLRYIKQLKVRSCELEYGFENVAVCEIRKDSNFIKFEFVSYSSEAEHLKEFSEEERENKQQAACEMHAHGVSNRNIAKELGVTEGTIRYWLRNA